MAELVNLAQLINELGYIEVLKIMTEDWGLPELDAKFLIDVELGIIESDIEGPE